MEKPSLSPCACMCTQCASESHSVPSCLDLDDLIQGRAFLCLNYKAAFTQLITQSSVRYGPVFNTYREHGLFNRDLTQRPPPGKYHRANTAAGPHCLSLVWWFSHNRLFASFQENSCSRYIRIYILNTSIPNHLPSGFFLFLKKIRHTYFLYHSLAGSLLTAFQSLQSNLILLHH